MRRRRPHGWYLGWAVIGWAIVSAVSIGCESSCRQIQESQVQAVRGLDRATRMAILQDMQAIRTALIQYAAMHGTLPDGDIRAIMRVLVPTYLPRPITSSHGAPIVYRKFDTRFELRSPGPDGQLDTADDLRVTGP